jgi:hypothetical protein
VPDEMLTAPADALEQVLRGAPAGVESTVREALAAYAAPSRGPQDETAKAAKLRGAFNELVDWLLAKRLPDLNDAQWLFLSTGALGASAEGADLMPPAVYAYLAKARADKASRPAWGRAVLDMEDRIHAIARGELVGMDPTYCREWTARSPRSRRCGMSRR